MCIFLDCVQLWRFHQTSHASSLLLYNYHHHHHHQRVKLMHVKLLGDLDATLIQELKPHQDT